MKVLVVYYSYEGNTELVAKTIAESVGASRLALRPVDEKRRKGFGKFLWGGRQVLMRAEPELEPFEIDPAGFDLLFLGTPVWAGTFAPAIRSFLSRSRPQGKPVAAFCCYGGSAGGTFRRLREELPGCRIVAELGLRDPKRKDTEAQLRRAAEWAREALQATAAAGISIPGS